MSNDSSPITSAWTRPAANGFHLRRQDDRLVKSRGQLTAHGYRHRVALSGPNSGSDRLGVDDGNQRPLCILLINALAYQFAQNLRAVARCPAKDAVTCV